MGLISRDRAILKCQERLYESALNNVEFKCKADEVYSDIAQNRIKDWLNELPTAEPLTDAEQRIFLKAMAREEEVCKIVDEVYKGEGYTLNLVHVCQEIIRKVKGTLWT